MARRIGQAIEDRRRRWAEYALFEEEPDDDLSRGDPSENPYIPRSRRLRDRIRQARRARSSLSYAMVEREGRKEAGEKLKFRLSLLLLGFIAVAALVQAGLRAYRGTASHRYSVHVTVEEGLKGRVSPLLEALEESGRYRLVDEGGDVDVYIGATRLEDGWTCYGFITTGGDYWKNFAGPSPTRDECVKRVVEALLERLGLVEVGHDAVRKDRADSLH